MPRASLCFRFATSVQCSNKISLPIYIFLHMLYFQFEKPSFITIVGRHLCIANQSTTANWWSCITRPTSLGTKIRWDGDTLYQTGQPPLSNIPLRLIPLIARGGHSSRSQCLVPGLQQDGVLLLTNITNNKNHTHTPMVILLIQYIKIIHFNNNRPDGQMVGSFFYQSIAPAPTQKKTTYF